MTTLGYPLGKYHSLVLEPHKGGLGLSMVYALHDSVKGPPTRINIKDAKSWNEKGYGIFASVNSFHQKRQKKLLTRINAWFVEIDSTSKDETLKELLHKGLVPSMVVESKRGYHVYWVCLEPSFELAKNTFDDMMKYRLVPFYNADPNAKDISRILRMPGFFHMKDPSAPFLVQKVWQKKVGYTVAQMLRAYPDTKKKKEKKNLKQKLEKEMSIHGGFWDVVFSLNCEYALTKLSGSNHVNNEIYDFIDNANGTKQIVCNDKPTSCWIDKEGRIGSYDSGGPTIFQWLKYFGKSSTEVIEIIKKEFPECQAAQLPLI